MLILVGKTETNSHTYLTKKIRKDEDSNIFFFLIPSEMHPPRLFGDGNEGRCNYVRDAKEE